MRSKKIRIAVLAAMSAGLVSTGTTPVEAHTGDSKVVLHVSDNTVRPNQTIVFFGKLRGTRHRFCKRGSTIELVRKGQGVVATDRTDRQGEFRFREDPQPNRGRYFARYRGSGRFGYGNGHLCRRDRSRTIRIRRA